MVPSVNILTEEIDETIYPNKTYGIVVKHTGNADASNPVDRIDGYVDDLEAVKQSIYLILGTERYQFNIYSWDYGVELLDLFGKPIPYVMSELSRRIKEALTQDDRIEDVTDFKFEVNGHKLMTTFTVITTFGNIHTDLEVTI